MDPRRLLAIGAIAVALAGCSHLQRLGLSRPPGALAAATATPAAAASPAPTPTAPVPAVGAPAPDPSPDAHAAAPNGRASEASARTFATMAPVPNPGRRSQPEGRRRAAAAPAAPPLTGRMAIAAANATAREASRSRGFVGGVQVFAYDPGRVYEVWTAPLRVTTLSLSRGEVVISKAAGDTVRWQIGETQSGEGPDQRAHVMIKPLVRGLETNLVLATNRRVYLVQLRSGDPAAFNAAVTWDLQSVIDAAAPQAPAPPVPAPMVTPQGPLDAGFRIRAKGRRPAWTPSAVATDGVRTFLSFPPGVTLGEAPALFALGPRGDVQLVNYRQQGGLWVVDRVLGAAELRMGGRRPQVVRIQRIGAAS